MPYNNIGIDIHFIDEPSQFIPTSRRPREKHVSHLPVHVGECIALDMQLLPQPLKLLLHPTQRHRLLLLLGAALPLL